MLKVHTLTLGQLQVNCYIVYDTQAETCAVIDPGASPERVLAEAARLGKRVEAVLLTHGHFDHVGAVEAIVKATGCALWMHEGDYLLRSGPMNNYLYPLHGKPITGMDFCEESDEIHAGGLTFTVLHTPGHSLGSVCFQSGDVLFTGDTLFAGGCGRTDLSGGDWMTIVRSLQRLSTLRPDFRVFPGHGESTTLAQEKLYNPYMR